MKKFVTFIKQNDRSIATVFALLSVAFVVLAFTSSTVMDWVFARHENTLSWFIRPLFLIPFCLFAFHRSLSGISITMFLLLTSMFWFPQPAETSEMVREFLAYEKDYLLNDWNVAKIAMTLLVPATMTLLAYAFWKRSLWLGLSTLAAIAVMKSLWSVFFGGESGTTVIVPAMVGLLICCVFIYFGLRAKKKKPNKR